MRLGVIAYVTNPLQSNGVTSLAGLANHKLVIACYAQRDLLTVQSYDGAINFATNAWTSPNHCTFVAFTVHIKHEGKPLVLLLDLLKVSYSRSRQILAEEFEVLLEEFRIAGKVSTLCAFIIVVRELTDVLLA